MFSRQPQREKLLFLLLALAAIVSGCTRLQTNPAGSTASEQPMQGKSSTAVPSPALPAGTAVQQNRLLTVGQAAPIFDLKQIGGGRLSLAQLRGEVVLLSFWEPSCPPCHVEAPHLEELHRKYQKVGLRVIGITPLASIEAIHAFKKKHRITYQILVDPGERVIRRFGLQGYPATFLIDRRGVVRFNHSGFQPSDATMLEKMLQEQLK